MYNWILSQNKKNKGIAVDKCFYINWAVVLTGFIYHTNPTPVYDVLMYFCYHISKQSWTFFFLFSHENVAEFLRIHRRPSPQAQSRNRCVCGYRVTWSVWPDLDPGQNLLTICSRPSLYTCTWTRKRTSLLTPSPEFVAILSHER